MVAWGEGGLRLLVMQLLRVMEKYGSVLSIRTDMIALSNMMDSVVMVTNDDGIVELVGLLES